MYRLGYAPFLFLAVHLNLLQFKIIATIALISKLYVGVRTKAITTYLSPYKLWTLYYGIATGVCSKLVVNKYKFTLS